MICAHLMEMGCYVAGVDVLLTANVSCLYHGFGGWGHRPVVGRRLACSVRLGGIDQNKLHYHLNFLCC